MNLVIRFIEPFRLVGINFIKDPGFRFIFKNPRPARNDRMMDPDFDALRYKDGDIANDIPDGNDSIAFR
jgi:hypothetical protein